jgi:hypothetical protein
MRSGAGVSLGGRVCRVAYAEMLVEWMACYEGVLDEVMTGEVPSEVVECLKVVRNLEGVLEGRSCGKEGVEELVVPLSVWQGPGQGRTRALPPPGWRGGAGGREGGERAWWRLEGGVGTWRWGLCRLM